MWLELISYAIVSGILFYGIYKWATVNNDYFAKRRIKHLYPTFLIGNTSGIFTNRRVPTEFFDSIYYRFPNEKLTGLFDGRKPVYFVRDVDFIRQITIKDFDNFEDHIAFIDSDSDSLFGKSLIMLNGKKWHDMRSTLSPAFTGSKMRHMFELVVECAEDMAKHLSNDTKQGKPVRWEMKELFSQYTSDVIASCAFGLKVNSLEDRTNEFFTIGRSSLNFSSKKTAMRLILLRTFPKLMRAINFELFSVNTRRFFKSMVLDTMEEREKRQIIRPDMINILMQVRKGNLKSQPEDEPSNDDAGFATTELSDTKKEQVTNSWTDDELVAQCFVFFAAGFDTASTLMIFFAYEMAINQDIQQKLYEEIRTVNESLNRQRFAITMFKRHFLNGRNLVIAKWCPNGRRLTYDALSKLKYLDQVISESLRKWPPAIFTNRRCTKNYEFDYNGRKIQIERGRDIWIPIISIHHDPEHYENPEKFDPERFSDENKHNIKSGTFIPFGLGPRNCIGSRFALMETKALCFYLLLNFNIQPYEKTEIPVRIANTAFNLNPDGIHLELKKRL